MIVSFLTLSIIFGSIGATFNFSLSKDISFFFNMLFLTSLVLLLIHGYILSKKVNFDE